MTEDEMDNEAMRLGGLINLRLKEISLRGLDDHRARRSLMMGEVAGIVAEVAPNWAFQDATRMGDASPSVILTTYEPDVPL